MKNITLNLFLAILFIGGIFLNVQHVVASNLVINNIEVHNFLPSEVLHAQDDIYSVNATDTFAIDYAPDAQKFQIIVLQQPYDENRALAERAFVEKLGVTKAEACYLNVAIVAPAYVTDQPDSNKLQICTPQNQADINNDGVVNTFDFAICIDEMNSEHSPNESLECDINVNRRIDATDLSSIITYIKKQ